MKYLCDNCSPKIGCINRFQNKKTECDSYVPMNNEQFIRFCDTEQLADVIADFYLLGFTHGHNKMDITSRTKWVEWLKEPHKDGES